MKRRVRVLPPGYLVGTKGHSVLKKKTYVRKPLIEVEEFSSQKMPTSRRHEFDSGYHVGSFHDARAFSNAVMDDSYDLQAQSRGRDHRLMSHMNTALVSTDLRRPPKAAVAALRASRTPVLASKPFSLRATHRPKSKEVPATGPYYLSSLAGYTMPGRTKRILTLSSNYRPTVLFLDSDEYSALYPRSTKFGRADPLYIGKRATARPFYQHRHYLPWYAGWRAVARGRYLRSVPRIYYGRAYQLPELTFKALLVGDDKLDILDRPRSRKPRTRYYADKLQNMEDKEQLSSIMAAPPTSKLKASKPPKPIPTYTWRAIRDVDGYTKPANVMSWQYRLESRVEPDDLIHKPSTYGKMRDQVRGVQDKLDRHRQLLDRHADRVVADTGYGDSYAAGGHFSAGRTTEEGGADGTGKVSPLRKKLRKVICKSRHDPSYYDE